MKEIEYLTFNEEYLKETFDFLMNYEGQNKSYPIYDTDHVLVRFRQRFPGLSDKNLYNTLLKGLRKIEKKFNFMPQRYMINSYSTFLKIPIDIRPDRNDPSKIIIAIATLLDSREHPINKYGELDILVENSKKNSTYERWQDYEGLDGNWYNHFIVDGIYHLDFEIIDCDKD